MSDRVETDDAPLALFFGVGTARETSRAIEQAQPDALVVDCLLAGALAAAELSGVPTAALFHVGSSR